MQSGLHLALVRPAALPIITLHQIPHCCIAIEESCVLSKWIVLGHIAWECELVFSW
jgi:hypothetical protein